MCSSDLITAARPSRQSSPVRFCSFSQIEPGSWPVPPVFGYLQDKGQVSLLEMYRTFNMGIGMIAIVGAREVEDLMQQFEAFGEKAYLIGEIRAASPGKAVCMSGLC